MIHTYWIVLTLNYFELNNKSYRPKINNNRLHKTKIYDTNLKCMYKKT